MTAPNDTEMDRWAAVDPAQRIRQLEEELTLYPESRAEILLDLGHVYATSGQPDQALAVYREVASAGDTHGELAWVEVVKTLFDLGRDEEARAELAAIRATGKTDGAAWHMAAELLEVRGEYDEALEWYDAIIDGFGRAERQRITDELGWMSPEGMKVRARRRTRRAAGLPPDDIDRWLPSQAEIEVLFDQTMAALVATQSTPSSAAHLVNTTGRTVFWLREQLAPAHLRWPDAISPPADDYYEVLERRCHADVTAGVARVILVPATVDSYADFLDRAGGEPGELSTMQAYLRERADAGHTLHWPPSRNAACWCGSGAKYKKCCGRSPV